VSFDLHAGEILGVFGLLGSGRTELARALFGADPIRSGSIEMQGKLIAENTLQCRSFRNRPGAEERSAQALFSQLSIIDNMTSGRPWLYSRFGFIRSRRRRELVDDMSRRVRLKAASMGQIVSTLSGGNQQKVVLGRWMLGGSRILILDDPTVGVDIGAKVEIYRLISELTADGTAVLSSPPNCQKWLGYQTESWSCSVGVSARFSTAEMQPRKPAPCSTWEAA